MSAYRTPPSRPSEECDARNEADVRDAHAPADEVSVHGENPLEHAKHAQHLLLVSLDRAWDLLRVEEREPSRLPKVRTAAVDRCQAGAKGNHSEKEETTHPCPEAWKKSHWMLRIFSS